MATLYEKMGGESKLRAVIDDFVNRVVDDIMIGFFFRSVDRQRLKELEWQHAAQLLGGPVRYSGRSLDVAHRRHRIMGGQFARRKQILKEVLRDHAVDDVVSEAWLAHVERLRSQITADAGSDCDPVQAAARAAQPPGTGDS